MARASVPGNTVALESHMAVKGTCIFMCPEEEIAKRESENLISVFEIDPDKSRGGGKKLSSSWFAVKEFVRSGAGRELAVPHLLRPTPVLVETLDYLLRKVVARSDVNWLTVYNFANNRMKCIVQDMTVQCIEGPEAISIYEQMVRFYLYSQAKLVDSQHKFDPVLNHEQFQKCLQKLMSLYDINCIDPDRRCECYGYFILSRLGSTESFQHYYAIPQPDRHRDDLSTIHKMNAASVQKNFVRFFRLAKQLKPLARSSLLPKVDLLRRDGLAVLSVAAGSQMKSQLPLQSRKSLVLQTFVRTLWSFWQGSSPPILRQLQGLLGMPSREMTAGFCIHHGLATNEGGNVILCKMDFEFKKPSQFASQTFETGLSSLKNVSALLIHGTNCGGTFR